MGLLPVQQTAPVVAPQLQPQLDGVTGYGSFTERQRLSSGSSTPVASRLTLPAAPERISTAERHITVLPPASQNVHDHRVAVHNACLLLQSSALPVTEATSSLVNTAAPRLLCTLAFHTPHVVLPGEIVKQPSSKLQPRRSTTAAPV